MPPLPPRCRCAIIYDEVAAPKLPKPSKPQETTSSYKTFEELRTYWANNYAAFGESLGYNFMTIHTEEELLTALRESLKSGKPYELPDDVKRLIEQGARF